MHLSKRSWDQHNSHLFGCVRNFVMLITVCILLFFPRSEALAQEQPTLAANGKETKVHSPTRAALFSAVLPGLGQAYNKKYWKIPIVYAGFGLLTYFVISNTDEYKKYNEAYKYVASGDSSHINNDYVIKYDEQQLLDARNYYRRNMELSYIIGGLWYILNIIDASVDAHFFDYDISEDLSIRIDPMMHRRREDPGAVTGVRLTIRF
jgi:hypothetical protein